VRAEAGQTQQQSPALWLLLICAGASLAIYGLFFASAYPLFEYFAIPLRDLGKITGYTGDAALRFFGAFAALFALYVLAYRLASNARAAAPLGLRLVVLAAPFVFGLPLLATFPVGAIDVYDYSFFSRMIGYYKANPMIHAPADFPGDGWLAYVAWPQATSPYGPLWQWLTALVYTLARDNLLATLIAFKVVAAGSLLAAALLAYLILRAWRPQDALKGYVFIAWNPLLLFEAAGNAHNDSLMAAFVLLALWLHLHRRPTLAVVALVLAAFIKLPAVFALPVFAVASVRGLMTWRVRLRWLIVASIASLAVAALIYLPLATGPNPFGNLSAHQDLFTTSFAAIAVFLARSVVTVASAQMLILRISLVLFAGVMLWILSAVNGTFASLAHATYLSFFALLLIATIWFQAWYLVWMLVLAPLAPHGARSVAGLFSATALAIYLVYDFALYWAPWFFIRDDGLTLNVLTVGLVFGPPLILLTSQHIRSRGGTLLRQSAEWPAGQHDLLGNV
jgi:hypothetical protein